MYAIPLNNHLTITFTTKINKFFNLFLSFISELQKVHFKNILSRGSYIF